eukprot:499902_1
MNIVIDILALNFNDFGKRFKYEHNIFAENNGTGKFQMSALDTVNATIRHKIINKPVSKPDLDIAPDIMEDIAEHNVDDHDKNKPDTVPVNIVVEDKDKHEPKPDIIPESEQQISNPQPSERDEWNKGSKCEIYSNSQKQWFAGIITDILNDDEGEWLKVQYIAYNIKKNKQIQRYNKQIRSVIDHEVDSDEKLEIEYNSCLIEKTNPRKVVYGYLSQIMDGLNEKGYKDMNKILSAIQGILTVDKVISKMKKGKSQNNNGKVKNKTNENIDGWRCKKCTLINYKEFKKCIACDNPK